MTQKEIILKYLEHLHLGDREGGWVYEYRLRSIHTPFGWLGSQGDRRCRELAQEGKLERKKDGKYAMYRYARKELVMPSARTRGLQPAIL